MLNPQSGIPLQTACAAFAPCPFRLTARTSPSLACPSFEIDRSIDRWIDTWVSGIARCIHGFAVLGPSYPIYLIYRSFNSAQGASAFNKPLNLDTSSVTDMSGMFQVRPAPLRPMSTRTFLAH